MTEGRIYIQEQDTWPWVDMLNPIDTFLVSVSGESQGSCFIQDNGCDIGSGGFGYWYTTSEIPMIRMSFDISVLNLNESSLNRKD